MKINEIFYSLQGEGYYSGWSAVFIRFSGCNLRCYFCDTDFKSYTEMSEDEIITEINKYPSNLVVLTGGEPSLQITQSFIDKLQDNNKYVAIETNGTNELPQRIDWITCSPKRYYTKAALKIKQANESKIVVDDVVDIDTLASHCPESMLYYIQPCDTGNKDTNERIIERCVDYVKSHPKWKLSLQTQKILNIR